MDVHFCNKLNWACRCGALSLSVKSEPKGNRCLYVKCNEEDEESGWSLTRCGQLSLGAPPRCATDYSALHAAACMRQRLQEHPCPPQGEVPEGARMGRAGPSRRERA